MTIQGSLTPATGEKIPEMNSHDTIEGDGSGHSLAEIKDTEYDEFKKSDSNIIEMKVSEAKAETLLAEQPKDMLLKDMTIDQLRNAVVNLMKINKDYEERARRIQIIWSDKNSVKARYFMLRDNPKAKGVKIR